MPKIDAERFFRELEKGPSPSVVALGGEARVLVDDALALIRQKTLAAGLADFNHERLVAKSGIDAVVSASMTLPMMADMRLVEVDRCEDLGDDAHALLEKYLKSPSPTTVLVLKFDAIDLRSKLIKLIDKHAPVARFEHPRERDMPGIVHARARRFRVDIDDDTALALALTIGTDVGLVDRALEKLALVCEGRPATIDDVSVHVADTHLEDAFAFASAVGAADRQEALKRLAALQRNRAAPLQLVGLLAWQLRQVLKARELLDDGRSPGDVRETLRAFGPRGGNLIDGARVFDRRGHERRLARLGLVDKMLKSSRAKDTLWMDRLVLELCPERASERARRQS